LTAILASPGSSLPMRGWPRSSLEPAASSNTPFKPAARQTVQDPAIAISAAGSNAYWLCRLVVLKHRHNNSYQRSYDFPLI